VPRFKEAFIAYHWPLAAGVAGGYALVELVANRPDLLATLDPGVRSNLYLSLAGTSGVLLGFGLAAITFFTGLGSGRGMDFLRGTPGFGYTRKVFMGAIWAFAFATVWMTVMIVGDAAQDPKEWLEVIAVGILALMVLRTWSLLWLLNRLLDQVLKDAADRHARKINKLAA
jgi:hypothetical protein